MVLKHCDDLESEKSLIRNKANAKSLDGVHLTQEGYRLMAEMIAGLLKDTVKPSDVVVCFGDSITLGAGMKGQGTAFGETYPAWLAVCLNRAVGAEDLRQPPEPPASDPESLVLNGGFEMSDDGVHATDWLRVPEVRRHDGTPSRRSGRRRGVPCAWWAASIRPMCTAICKESYPWRARRSCRSPCAGPGR